MKLTTAATVLLSLLALCHGQNVGASSNQEGSSCVTPNSHAGRCISVLTCGPIMTILSQPPVSDLAKQFMHQAQCGFKGKTPLVCCDSNNVEFADRSNPWLEATTTTNSLDNHPNIRLLPREVCGKQFTQRIVGGNVTSLEEYPWTALLQYKKGSKKKFLCGGVLINSRYVLTAAHCTSKANLGGWKLEGVRLGEHDLDEEEDCVEDVFNSERLCADPVRDIAMEKEIVHPEYVGQSTNQFHDIALMRLREEVLYANSNYIRPICIPTTKEVMSKDYSTGDLTVTGWGKTETRSSSPVKLKVSLPMVSNAACARIYSAKKRTISEHQMCAGGIQGKDSCNGDSGGPLMSNDRVAQTDSDHFHVTGIVSYGPTPCGEVGWPGVYTRVADYSKWILDQLKP